MAVAEAGPLAKKPHKQKGSMAGPQGGPANQGKRLQQRRPLRINLITGGP